MINPIPASIPTIGQRETMLKASISQGLQQIATQIYVQLVVEYLKEGDDTLDPETLQQLAKDSLQAAQSYFQGLGIAQFQDHQHAQT